MLSKNERGVIGNESRRIVSCVGELGIGALEDIEFAQTKMHYPCSDWLIWRYRTTLVRPVILDEYDVGHA
jgi:hypothetical protein